MCCLVDEEQVEVQVAWLASLPPIVAEYKSDCIVFVSQLPRQAAQILGFDNYFHIIDETQPIDFVTYLEGKVAETKGWLVR